MYSRSELRNIFDNNPNTTYSRETFEALQSMAEHGQSMSIAEIEFFCLGVNSSIRDDGSIEDFEICDDYVFTSDFLLFWDYIVGQRVMGYKGFFLDGTEIAFRRARLRCYADSWYGVVMMANHTNTTLNELSSETRKQIKALRKKRRRKFETASFLIKEQYRKILNFSKYVYYSTRKVFEELEEDEKLFLLNGERIEFQESSFIHILIGHYAEIARPTFFDKTYHIGDFPVEELVNLLRQIISSIDSAGVYSEMEIRNVVFRYKRVLYEFWVSRKNRNVSGEMQIYNKFESFYPLKTEEKISEMEERYINEDIQVYINS